MIFRSTIGPIADHRRASGNSIDTNDVKRLDVLDADAALIDRHPSS